MAGKTRTPPEGEDPEVTAHYSTTVHPGPWGLTAIDTGPVSLFIGIVISMAHLTGVMGDLLASIGRRPGASLSVLSPQGGTTPGRVVRSH